MVKPVQGFGVFRCVDGSGGDDDNSSGNDNTGSDDDILAKLSTMMSPFKPATSASVATAAGFCKGAFDDDDDGHNPSSGLAAVFPQILQQDQVCDHSAKRAQMLEYQCPNNGVAFQAGDKCKCGNGRRFLKKEAFDDDDDEYGKRQDWRRCSPKYCGGNKVCDHSANACANAGIPQCPNNGVAFQAGGKCKCGGSRRFPEKGSI